MSVETIKPLRIRLSRAKGFDLQSLSTSLNGLQAINVARPTLFGNPFTHTDTAAAVEAYRRHCEGGTQHFEMGPGKLQFATNIHRMSLHHAWPEWLKTEGLPKLRGRNLACWCAPDKPCHADVLLELASIFSCDEVR
jgi:hypothetical protein